MNCHRPCHCNRNGECGWLDGTCNCFRDSVRGFWDGPQCSTCLDGYLEPDCLVTNEAITRARQLPLVRPCPCPCPRDALEGQGPQRRPQRRSDRRLQEVAEAVGGGYCRLQMPLKLAPGVRETAAGRRLGALEGGAVTSPPFQCIPALPLPLHPSDRVLWARRPLPDTAPRPKRALGCTGLKWRQFGGPGQCFAWPIRGAPYMRSSLLINWASAAASIHGGCASLPRGPLCLWAWPAKLVYGTFEMGYVENLSNTAVGLPKKQSKPKYKLHTVFVFLRQRGLY